MPLLPKQDLQRLIADARTAEALQRLLEILIGMPNYKTEYKSINILSSQWQELNEAVRLNLLSFKSASIHRSRINAALLDYLENLPDQINTVEGEFIPDQNQKEQVYGGKKQHESEFAHYKNGTTHRDNNGLPMPMTVFVEGGNFFSEVVSKDIVLPDFFIGIYPITFNEYLPFCKASGRNIPSDSGWGHDTRPVINVSIEDAKAYCKWLSNRTKRNYDIPNKVQWEYAAKGGNLSKNYEYSGSNNLDEVGWYYDNSGEYITLSVFGIMKEKMYTNRKTHPVGQKKPNELGLFDMSGNVFEWCNWFEESKNNSDLTPTSGGSHSNSESSAVANCRGSYYKSLTKSSDCGFRVIMSI
jgi:sulfatase modifying factor 1